MKPPKNAIEAWHFLPSSGRARYSNEPVTVGSVLHVPGKVELCNRGLHASVRAIDALQYAPGAIACRVLVWGDVQRQTDKLAGQYRQCTAMADVTNTLHEFACCVAEAAMLLADVTDERSWQAIEAKRAWQRGQINNAQLAAAWDTAWDAARAAAMAAAMAAARAAASMAAARAAADRAAASAAAWDAARGEMNATLGSMLMEVCQ